MIKSLFRNFLDINKVVDILPLQITNFVIIGGISFLVDIGFLILFVELFSLNVIIATIFSMTISTTVNYFLSIKFVFINGKYKLNTEVSIFYLWAILGFLLNLGLMWFLAEYLEIWYIYARFVSVAIVSVLNFLFKKKIVFLK